MRSCSVWGAGYGVGEPLLPHSLTSFLGFAGGAFTGATFATGKRERTGVGARRARTAGTEQGREKKPVQDYSHGVTVTSSVWEVRSGRSGCRMHPVAGCILSSAKWERASAGPNLMVMTGCMCFPSAPRHEGEIDFQIRFDFVG